MNLLMSGSLLKGCAFGRSWTARRKNRTLPPQDGSFTLPWPKQQSEKTMSNAHSLRRVSILATEGVFASTLMQAKDFFHMASLRLARQLGGPLAPAFERGW